MRKLSSPKRASTNGSYHSPCPVRRSTSVICILTGLSNKNALTEYLFCPIQASEHHHFLFQIHSTSDRHDEGPHISTLGTCSDNLGCDDIHRWIHLNACKRWKLSNRSKTTRTVNAAHMSANSRSSQCVHFSSIMYGERRNAQASSTQSRLQVLPQGAVALLRVSNNGYALWFGRRTSAAGSSPAGHMAR